MTKLKLNKLDHKDDDVNKQLDIGENALVINIGKSDNTDNKVINIGGIGDTVNILATTKNTNVENVNIQNKIM